MAESYTYEEFAELLRQKWGDDVAVWQTGGGVMNPVICLEVQEGGEWTFYVMFSMGWDPSEASFGVYWDGYNEGWEPLVDFVAEGDAVPMEPEAIFELIESRILEAENRRGEL